MKKEKNCFRNFFAFKYPNYPAIRALHKMTDTYIKRGLIEADELNALLQSGQNIRLVDASYGGPDNGRGAFNAGRIHNAVFFDIDEIADPYSDMTHMLPTPADFARAVSEMGIGNDDYVVIYDQSGIAMAASRAWWMFRVYGHDKVCVLNGGLPYWMARGYPLNQSPHEYHKSSVFQATYRPELVQSLNGVQQALGSAEVSILDARSAERFAGRAREPRPGLRAGHIPGSANLPYTKLINPGDGRLQNAEEIKAVLGGLSLRENVITSCGSGVTACVLALAFYTTGRPDVAVYDGSWTEWGREDRKTEVAVLS